jgi:hypothetical protein
VPWGGQTPPKRSRRRWQRGTERGASPRTSPWWCCGRLWGSWSVETRLSHCKLRPTVTTPINLPMPTVSLGVTSAVVSSCGHDSGHIEHRVAHELAGHWATHERPAEGTQHRHPPHAQPLAPVRQHHGRRPRLTPRGCTDHTSPSDEGHPCGRIREEQRHHRSLVPRDARPRRRSSFRLLGMASPYWMTYVSY